MAIKRVQKLAKCKVYGFENKGYMNIMIITISNVWIWAKIRGIQGKIKNQVNIIKGDQIVMSFIYLCHNSACGIKFKAWQEQMNTLT